MSFRLFPLSKCYGQGNKPVPPVGSLVLLQLDLGLPQGKTVEYTVQQAGNAENAALGRGSVVGGAGP